jgi:hypothetical protein
MKLLAATCIGGLITADGLPVIGATILSEGLGPSSGILVLQDDDGKYYIAKTSTDLNTTLTQLITALSHVASALSAIDVKPVGGTGSAPAPAAAGDIAAITSASAALATLQGLLK